jgi:hypothetical protein
MSRRGRCSAKTGLPCGHASLSALSVRALIVFLILNSFVFPAVRSKAAIRSTILLRQPPS